MSFGIEQEGGSLIVPMALAHPLHPINDRSRNKRRNLWVGWCVSSWWPMFSSRSSVSLYIYLYVCIIYTGSGYSFLWFQPFVSYSMVIRSILGCLWPLVSVLDYILTLGILRSVIFHFPGCFCPWTFFQNIGFNIPSDSFMSHLYTELEYSTREFQALQLIVLAVFGVVD